MSRGDGWSVVATLIAGGAGYLIGGPKAAWVCIALGVMGALILHFTRNVNYRTDLWLGFDFNTWGPESSALCVQNKGKEPIFNVVVNIPDDGSELKSNSIDRLEADGQPVSCSVKKGKVRDAVDSTVVARSEKLYDIVRDENGRIKEAKMPMRVAYTDGRGKRRKYNEFEILLPFKDSSIKRKTKSLLGGVFG
jgi:hypothetical protein